jgi:hypothetical protein
MRILFAAALMLLVAGGASALVVNFDDLQGQDLVPDGYGGINWPGWYYYDSDQFPYNPSSPPCRVYNYTDPRFFFLEDSYFMGAFFNGYGSSDGFKDITLYGYYQGNLVGQSATLPLFGDGVGGFLDSGFADQMVDEIYVDGYPGFFIMDDVTYEVVPEPGTVTAFAGLVLGLGGILWRRK